MQHYKLLIVLTSMLLLATGGRAQSQKNVHYRGMVEAGFVAGLGTHGEAMLGGVTSHGVEISSLGLYLGAGAGYRHIFEGEFYDGYSIPVFLNVRYTTWYSGVRPFLDLKVGDGLLMEASHDGGGDNSGGLMVNPSIGISFPNQHRAQFYFSVGYTYQRCTHSYEFFPNQPTKSDDKRNIGGLTFSLGLTF